MAASGLLRLIAAAFTVLALLCLWAFRENYWSRRDCFDALGRCFDPGSGAVYTEAGAAWGVLALLLVGASLFLVAVAHWLSRRRERSTRPQP